MIQTQQSSYPRITLKAKRDFSLRRFHPWVFSGAIGKYEPANVGDIVEVYSHEGEFLATGYIGPESIAVKILSFERIVSLEDFWHDALAKAYRVRRDIGLVANPNITAYRLVNAEGDNLPGLIIDIYHHTAVVQFHAWGMYRQRELIVRGLKTLLGIKLDAIYTKVTETLLQEQHRIAPGAAGNIAQDSYLYGNSASGISDAQTIVEYGHSFLIDWEQGQKTGFFIDQRENRKLLAQFAPGKKVLNAFSYTGAFTIYALQAGATEVDSVDTSERALYILKQNIKLNSCSQPHQEIHVDCFNYCQQTEKKYNLVILDPPAFVKHKQAVAAGLKGYTTLNAQALKILEPGGILFTFSCSQLVTREMFRNSVFLAGIQSRRTLRILYELHQSPCHPVNMYHPEGEYLKGFVIEVG